MFLTRVIYDPIEFERCFEILSFAFEHEYPYIEVVFPKYDTLKGREDGGDTSCPDCKVGSEYDIFKNRRY